MISKYIFISITALFFIWVIKDLFQKENTIKRNFPVFGNLRFLFIALGPAIRQYFIASNRDELPFIEVNGTG